MIIEVIPRIGGAPIRLDASQILVRNDAGTPIMVAGEFGQDRMQKLAHALDPDFNRVLQAFGYKQHSVAVDILELDPPPSGAKRLVTPG